jgi:spermidine synthase
MHKYNFGPISIIFLVLYFLIGYFVKSGKISLANNRKIWNCLLLISFIISGALGLLLLLPNHDIELPYKDDLLALHVQTGIVMTYCSFIHFTWHKQYYRIKKD